MGLPPPARLRRRRASGHLGWPDARRDRAAAKIVSCIGAVYVAIRTAASKEVPADLKVAGIGTALSGCIGAGGKEIAGLLLKFKGFIAPILKRIGLVAAGDALLRADGPPPAYSLGFGNSPQA